jgi:hypothetical protein
MGQISLRHDCAWAGARSLVEIVVPCLREEERRDAFEEFYRVCAAMIEAYEQQMQREAARLCKPSRN